METFFSLLNPTLPEFKLINNTTNRNCGKTVFCYNLLCFKCGHTFDKLKETNLRPTTHESNTDTTDDVSTQPLCLVVVGAKVARKGSRKPLASEINTLKRCEPGEHSCHNTETTVI